MYLYNIFVNQIRHKRVLNVFLYEVVITTLDIQSTYYS